MNIKLHWNAHESYYLTWSCYNTVGNRDKGIASLGWHLRPRDALGPEHHRAHGRMANHCIVFRKSIASAFVNLPSKFQQNEKIIFSL